MKSHLPDPTLVLRHNGRILMFFGVLCGRSILHNAGLQIILVKDAPQLLHPYIDYRRITVYVDLEAR